MFYIYIIYIYIINVYITIIIKHSMIEYDLLYFKKLMCSNVKTKLLIIQNTFILYLLFLLRLKVC